MATPLTTASADLAALTKTRKVRFWGREYDVTPHLIEGVLGDGRQLIYLTPLMTRPNYYIVRIDSGADFDSDEWPDYLEDIYQLIEGECGNSEWEGYEGEGFPVLTDGGSCWGHLYAHDAIVDETIEKRKAEL